jgi:hypothetical protein
MKTDLTTLPPIPAKTGPGQKRSGPVPAWGLKLGSLMTTFAIFAGSFGFARANLYVTNAPLQPATVAASAGRPAASPAVATTRTTTTLTSSIRTTTRPAVTFTKSS